MKSNFRRLLVFTALLIVLLSPIVAYAEPPVEGTLDLVNTPSYGGYALLSLTWNRHVNYPALWFTCYQDGEAKYAVAREPVMGDGTAIVDIGLPIGVFWDPEGGVISCTAQLLSYDVRTKPFVHVRSITPLDDVSFDL